jgi:hypothetical protein
MRLELTSGRVIDDAPEADLWQYAEGEEFATLSAGAPHTSIQCAEPTKPPWEYVREYRDGGPDRHHAAAAGPVTLERVLSAFAE